MTPQQTFYLSRSIGARVTSNKGQRIGKVIDVFVNPVAPEGNVDDIFRPNVVGLSIKIEGKEKIIDYQDVVFKNINGQYIFECSNPSDLTQKKLETALPLAKSFLDRQIVDINGRKLVRVNDVRLVSIASGTFAIAVDIGAEGLLRRLGIAKPISKLLKLFKLSIPTEFILWDDVEAFDTSNYNIRISRTSSKLHRLHPSDLADIIEEMGSQSRTKVFEALDEDQAADVLEEMEPSAQAQIIESLPIDKAADVLEKMPADEVADLFDELEDEKIELLLNEMEKESSEEVRELLEYNDKEVGSLMTTDFMSFLGTQTVEETLEKLRMEKPEADMIYSLFVVDETEKLIGTLPLRDIVVSPLTMPLSEIMKTNLISVVDEDPIDTLALIILKYDLLAIPVIDASKKLVGMVVIDDIVEDLMEKGKTRKGAKLWR